MEAENSILDAYDFDLPRAQIAQHPARDRDGARLLVLNRTLSARHHSIIRELPNWLRAGDLLVVNCTRVLPARLRGRKRSGGSASALILGPAPTGDTSYLALLRCSGRQRVGLKLAFGRPGEEIDAEIAALDGSGEVTLRFAPGVTPYSVGEAPLPPYIVRPAPEPADRDRYQTIYARTPGAVAAPTAGLHLSARLLGALDARGVERAELVLHVGAGTFRPVQSHELETGRLHAERYGLPEACARAISRARQRGGRVIAVGTTTTRVLETCASQGGLVRAGEGETRLFLRPGARFRVVDALLTNFHLPRSSLLMLVAALVGRKSILAAYADAVARGYRFYSYGDAMLIL